MFRAQPRARSCTQAWDQEKPTWRVIDADALIRAAARDGPRASDDHDVLHRALGERGAVIGHRSAYAAGPPRAVAA